MKTNYVLEEKEKFADHLSKLLGIHKNTIFHVIKDNNPNIIFSNPSLITQDASKIQKIELVKNIGNTLNVMSNLTHNKLILNSPDKINDFFKYRYKGMPKQEQFMVLGLNAKLELVNEKIVSKGGLDRTVVTPSIVFKDAIIKDVHKIIIAHNHPSGNPNPSLEDINITRRLLQSGDILGVQVLDHVIIGDNQIFSFRQHGLVFENKHQQLTHSVSEDKTEDVRSQKWLEQLTKENKQMDSLNLGDELNDELDMEL